ncbi:YqzE family protein [Aneurinibacillus terranovensis]|uniref:YqzE family protein n=1 Tax=Aneurinibacillus terranovensis TaxID=278991 RepID=UPI0004150F06|nr:YqzE family protein [Aneurinibacillus terranovensis]
MSSSQEYVRYLTERIVKYMETPKDQRVKKPKEPWTYRWFGILPLALRMMFRWKVK